MPSQIFIKKLILTFFWFSESCCQHHGCLSNGSWLQKPPWLYPLYSQFQKKARQTCDQGRLWKTSTWSWWPKWWRLLDFLPFYLSMFYHILIILFIFYSKLQLHFMFYHYGMILLYFMSKGLLNSTPWHQWSYREVHCKGHLAGV